MVHEMLASSEAPNRTPPKQVLVVPEISRFFGIVVRMYFNDHEPAHFHASSADTEVKIQIAPVGLMSGELPPRTLALVVEWATLHQRELLDNWRRLQQNETPHRVAPLE